MHHFVINNVSLVEKIRQISLQFELILESNEFIYCVDNCKQGNIWVSRVAHALQEPRPIAVFAKKGKSVRTVVF